MGVVTEEDELPRTIMAVMETWGQSSSNLLFYSIPRKDEDGRGIEDELWAWHGRWKRKGYGDTVRVVRVNEVSSSNRIMPILRHMYSALINQSDWFMYVPYTAYVRLMEVDRLLKDLDPNLPLLLGHHRDNTLGPRGGQTGTCDEGRGVVLSRQLLRELGGVMDAGECVEQEEEWPWNCLYKHLQVQCTPSNQVMYSHTAAES